MVHLRCTTELLLILTGNGPYVNTYPAGALRTSSIPLCTEDAPGRRNKKAPRPRKSNRHVNNTMPMGYARLVISECDIGNLNVVREPVSIWKKRRERKLCRSVRLCVSNVAVLFSNRYPCNQLCVSGATIGINVLSTNRLL